MKKVNVKLSSVADVKDFVTAISKYSFDAHFQSGRYVVDAKSIMGIFSLDLAKPVELAVHSDDCGSFLADIAKFIVTKAA